MGTETPTYPILQLMKRAAASDTDQGSSIAGINNKKVNEEKKSTLKFL
jgi:hypothetical protein